MPTPSALDNLTPEQRNALDREITRRNFANYDDLMDWLADQGLEISRSTVARHGNKLKKRLQQVKDATEGAKLLATAVNDDANLLSGAVISMLQSELFNVMVSLQELDENTPLDERARLLKDLTQSIRGCSSVAMDQKEFERLHKERADKDAVLQMEKTAKSAKALGVSDEAIKQIRLDVLGFSQ
ncbi:MAG: DUF3486 family protein [Methylococcales bacterium]